MADGAQFALLRWDCPLEACDWSTTALSDVTGYGEGAVGTAASLFVPGGAIHEHIRRHDVMEWASEVISLRAVLKNIWVERGRPAPRPEVDDRTVPGEVVQRAKELT